jgi:hypothetical protein
MGRKYKWIQQKKDHCGAACLEMILKRRGITHVSQEEIYKHTGKVLDKDGINSFFHDYRIALEAEFHPLSRIAIRSTYPSSVTDEIRSFLESNFENNDIIANYWVREMASGHYVLVNHVSEISVSFCDPDPGRNNTMAQFDALPILMSSLYDGKERGFFVIKSSQS